MFNSVVKEEIKVPAHIDYLGELRNFVTKAGRKNGFSDSIVNAFKLSIDEAATNIIKHAYRDWEGMIKMRVIIKKNSMTVVLVDQGKYFDPTRVKNPDLNRYVKIGKKGGLGIFIMRKLLDDIEYRHTEEGNELRLTKYKSSVPTKKAKPITTPSLGLSVKSRYSLIAFLILSTLVVFGYIFLFFKHSNDVMKELEINERPICDIIAKEALRDPTEGLNMTYLMNKLPEYLDGRPEIYRIIVTDTTNDVLGSTDTELVTHKFSLPEDHKIIHPGLISYDDDQQSNYSFISDIEGEVRYEGETTQKIKVGTVYLEVKRDYVSDEIWSRRLKDLQLAGLLLLLGYIGVVILVYLILNPFRKLSNWIKELGHGDVKDEIDFDANNEIGEIAKAFSDITDTLRDSQKNVAEQERIQKEMQLAQDIQHTLLPAEVPKLEGYEIAAFYQAARQVGGDYYDFIEVDKDTLGIVVADVSGKGVPGSLIMTMIRTALRTEARSMKSASEVLARVNDFVVKDMKKGMFVTLFYVIIDSRRRRVNYASAGHNPMILYRKATNKTYYFNPRGFPVGISLPDPDLFKKSIESDTIQMAEDDVLVIYTDGVTEAMNNRRELFGEERLQKVIRDYGDSSAEEFVENLQNEINSFTEGFEQNDDVTLVTIKEQSTPEKIELKRAQKAHKLILQGKNIRDACEQCGVTVYAYYNKYKKIFEEEGVDAFEIDETIAVEAKHISIEEKTKIYDIIKKHPEYGAKRISEELNTEKYSFTEINENRIYDELVRSRLNTRQLREAYVSRSGKKRRMKPPGTPMLTLDGKIILDKRFEDVEVAPIETTPSYPETKADRKQQPTTTPEEHEVALPEEVDDNFYLESLMSMPIEELLNKKRKTVSKKSTKDKDIRQSQLPPTESKPKQTEDDDDLFADFDDHAVNDSKEKDSIWETEALEKNELGPESGFDEEISFRDIWEQPDTDTNHDAEEKDQAELQKDSEPEVGPFDQKQGELTGEADEFEVPISEPTVDIDEILNESDDDIDVKDFELIIEQTSFRDVLTQDASDAENELGVDKEENGFVDGSTDKTLAGLEDDPEFDFEHLFETSELPLSFSEGETTSSEEDEDIDFTFSDLLSEIENEIDFAESEQSRNQFGPDHDTDINGSGEKFSETLSKLGITKSKRDKQKQISNKELLSGLKFYQAGEYQSAIEQFTRVIKLFPDFKEVYIILGNAYYHLNLIDKAVATYQKVKQIDPKDTDSYENIGVIFANQGNFDKAIEEWQMVVKINPERKDILEHIEEAQQLINSNHKQ
ncbi:MAG TPA: tetratricopeptide repeat protein [bacterium]|nr:tetratricopeptide repeat protein [bacterium]